MKKINVIHSIALLTLIHMGPNLDMKGVSSLQLSIDFELHSKLL